ncbi:hypothetical protein VMCG_01292 [Cytospora schulzeri]|uniref:Uncharacterized protein n=1 Tax=Cytospora schulzeri TaxID=448051 RepID=A0A423X7A1_9PEZI|nr:hypothetical protein VMCG_01292 [Valsa malicola]
MYSPEEISDIQDEEREWLDLLEDLMEEFSEEYRRRGVELTEFLCSCWAPRMVEVLAELDMIRLTEEERRGAECLGVKWDPSTIDEEEEEEEEEEEKKLRYWIRRLDEVAPVPDLPSVAAAEL